MSTNIKPNFVFPVYEMYTKIFCVYENEIHQGIVYGATITISDSGEPCIPDLEIGHVVNRYVIEYRIKLESSPKFIYFSGSKVFSTVEELVTSLTQTIL